MLARRWNDIEETGTVIITLLHPGFVSSHLNRLRRQVRHPVRPREMTFRFLGVLLGMLGRSEGGAMTSKLCLSVWLAELAG